MKQKSYGQRPACDTLLELAKDPPELPNEELDEQLDCAPPELEEEVASDPLGNEPATPFEAVLGPRGEVVAVAA
jgi:hypothetical protein